MPPPRNRAVTALVAVLCLAAGPVHAAAPGEAEPGPAVRRLQLFAARLLAQTHEVRSISERATIATRSPAGVHTLTQLRDVIVPDKLRRTLVVDGEERSVVISGGRGYMGSGGRWLPLPGDEPRKALDSIGRDLLVLADGVDDEGLEVLGSRSAQLDGVACEEVALRLRGTESILCIDERGEVLRQTFVGTDPLTGTAGRIEILYSDPREEGGVRYPHHQEMRFDGEPVMTVIVERLAVNIELDPASFDVQAAAP